MDALRAMIEDRGCHYVEAKMTMGHFAVSYWPMDGHGVVVAPAIDLADAILALRAKVKP